MEDRKQYAHLYDRTWRKLRDAFLRTHPLCRYCHELGLLTPATVVDHTVPHKGDRIRFYDQSNWQSLCGPCHNGVKQRLERTGHRAGTRPDGTPVDPMHPWNRTVSEPPVGSAEPSQAGGYGVQSLAGGGVQRTRSDFFAPSVGEKPIF